MASAGRLGPLSSLSVNRAMIPRQETYVGEVCGWCDAGLRRGGPERLQQQRRHVRQEEDDRGGQRHGEGLGLGDAVTAMARR